VLGLTRLIRGGGFGFNKAGLEGIRLVEGAFEICAEASEGACKGVCEAEYAASPIAQKGYQCRHPWPGSPLNTSEKSSLVATLKPS
jgi:hypothetical protein